MTNKFRVAGVAFEGEQFDYETTAESNMFDFVTDDVNQLVGKDHRDEASIHWVTPYKVIIEGAQRLYTIEQITL